MPTDLARLTTALTGRYRVDREVGAGGMATVYLAYDARHDRRVALKVLRSELAFRRGDTVMVAAVDAATGAVSPAVALFSGPYATTSDWTDPRSYDVTADGERFLLLKRPAGGSRARVNVVTKWFDELRTKVPR